MIKSSYLGDAVYATDIGCGAIMLTTDHHNPALASAQIILEPDVLVALDRYRERMKEAKNG